MLAPSVTLPEISITQNGAIGLITLTRPQVLNALSLEMIQTIDTALAAWADDATVRAVVVRGGEKAFCAGGDVRTLWQAKRVLAGQTAEIMAAVAAYFRAEYSMNHRINTYPKPYIALIDGITMGGGCGLSVHGSHRVATETTLLAMPETAIGIFPDVGATWFLNRCPGDIGIWMGLTGARLRAADALWAGLATHSVERTRLPALVSALAALPDAVDVAAAVDAVLADFHQPPTEPAALAGLAATIDAHFSADTVDEIIARLRQTGGDWAQAQLAALASMAPTSLKLTLAQLRGGRDLAIGPALAREFRMMCHSVVHRPDYDEGIRALLIDKDKQPRWSPASLAEVDAGLITAQFGPVPGEADLHFS